MQKFFKDINKKETVSWAFFDFANSSYYLLIISFVFPIYFKEVIAAGKFADFWWGAIISISILLGALFSPIVGAMADYEGTRKRKFVIFTLISVSGTALLYFTGSKTLLLTSLIFITTHFFYELAIVIYDSLLIQVSTKETVGRISGLGWGLGYIGGIVAMLALKPFYGGGFEGNLDSVYKLTFPLTALFFLLFSLPAFIFIKETRSNRAKISLIALLKIACKDVFATIKEIRKYKNIAWFLLAFYFVNDALVTVFAFVPIYAKTTLSLSVSEITILFLLIQLIGFPSTVFFGLLSDKKGAKKILLSTITLWAVIIILCAISTSKGLFYVASVLTGLVIGSSQAVARSWLSKIIPTDKRSEFFGFNGFATKVSATTGPVLFGTISSITGNQRIAMIALLPFFIIAFIIFAKIKE